MTRTGKLAVVLMAVGLAAGCKNDVGSTRQSIINPGPECQPARTPGFWCQNQDGQNPNLTAAEFDQLAAEAAALLSGVPELDTPEEIAARVCDTSCQLLRHLAALALNLAANLIDEDTPLIGEDYDTVGEAFEAAIAEAQSATMNCASEVKDVLDDINNNFNTDLEPDVCDGDEEPDAGVPDAPPEEEPDAPPGEQPDAPPEEEPDAPPPMKGTDASPVGPMPPS